VFEVGPLPETVIFAPIQHSQPTVQRRIVMSDRTDVALKAISIRYIKTDDGCEKTNV
jgi:hypothetical protein